MQLVDSKLYVANMPSLTAVRQGSTTRHNCFAARLKGIGASERLLALMLAAFVVTAGPAALSAVSPAVSLVLQILLQAGRFGLLAFQIFGR